MTAVTVLLRDRDPLEDTLLSQTVILKPFSLRKRGMSWAFGFFSSNRFLKALGLSNKQPQQLPFLQKAYGLTE